jgi:hypothetical protein
MGAEALAAGNEAAWDPNTRTRSGMYTVSRVSVASNSEVSRPVVETRPKKGDPWGYFCCGPSGMTFAAGSIWTTDPDGGRDARLGGDLRGPSFERELESVHQRRAQLRNALPVRAPDDLCLVGSTRLFDEVERKSLSSAAASTRNYPRTDRQPPAGSSSTSPRSWSTSTRTNRCQRTQPTPRTTT